MRKKCIKENWPKRPAYSIDAYADHYFHPDLAKIKNRFIEEHDEMYTKRKEA